MHRRALLSAVLLSCCGVAAHGAQFCSAVNVECEAGKAHLARHWEPVFSEDFEKGLQAWSLENYEANLAADVSTEQPHGGRQTFAVTWVRAVDTAWELKSEAIKVAPEAPYLLRFWVRANRALGTVAGHQGHYLSCLEWQGEDGQVIKAAELDYGTTDETWHQVALQGQTPAGATRARIGFGFDSPNFGSQEYLALDDIELLQRTAQTGYEPEGELVSRPFSLPAKAPTSVRWEAKTPAGTRLSLEVRTAPEDRGGPGLWSDFAPVAQGGVAAPPVTGARWLQYRASLSTSNRLVTPELAGVEVGALREASFDGVDQTAPILPQYGPARTADDRTDLGFTIADAGVGYDPRSLRMWLDDALVAPIVGRDGKCTYRPAEALVPPAAGAGFGSWLARNHATALVLKAAEARQPDGPASELITRAAGETDTAFALTSPEISVVGGEKYTLSFWLRTDVEVQGADDRYAGGVRWLDAEGKALGDPVRILYGVKNPEWHELRQDLTAPPGAALATISFGWDTPNITNRQFVQLAEPQLAGPHPARKAGGPNLHRVRVAAADYAGNRLDTTWYVLVKEAPASGHVTVRDDGVTLIDGKPFFPIGIYSVSKRPANGNSYDAAFKELREAGFNLAHTYANTRGAEFSEFYAAAARNGMKLFVAPETGNNSTDVGGALATVARECNESALLAWYLADDTAGWITAPDLQRVHQGVMQVDPYHMTTQADGISLLGDQRYVRYVNATTGFLPELYPIHETTGNHVADVIRGMKNIQEGWRAGGRVTPVWAIIQDFEGWGWKRFPTNEEERCMVYLALIHGAQGMTWYTYSYREPDKHGAPWDPKVWAYLKGIAGELSSLSGVLTSRDPKEQPRAEIVSGPAKGDLDYPSLNLRLKRWEGYWYLLAASSADQPLRARLTLPGLAKEAEVLFETRNLPVKDGTLEDTFAPLAVHVYRWRA